MIGKLIICPTPIGNLDDMTIRGLKVLESVDLIAAEDTRHTIKLLNRFEIKTKLFSYHEHNKMTSGPQLVEKMLNGETIALVSDAGMPGISDPGEDLVKLCIEASILVEALPGASAVITALAASGLSTRRFFFEGFLDRHKKPRRERLTYLETLRETIVFYESPHRLFDTLDDLLKIMGDRQIVLARELTKKFEEYFRGNTSDSIAYFKDKGVKGEFVILLEGNNKIVEKVFDCTIEEHLIQVMATGTTKKEAIVIVTNERDLPKKEVYQVAIEIKK